jgi:hypothetical protein
LQIHPKAFKKKFFGKIYSFTGNSETLHDRFGWTELERRQRGETDLAVMQQ